MWEGGLDKSRVTGLFDFEGKVERVVPHLVTRRLLSWRLWFVMSQSKLLWGRTTFLVCLWQWDVLLCGPECWVTEPSTVEVTSYIFIADGRAGNRAFGTKRFAVTAVHEHTRTYHNYIHTEWHNVTYPINPYHTYWAFFQGVTSQTKWNWEYWIFLFCLPRVSSYFLQTRVTRLNWNEWTFVCNELGKSRVTLV